MPPELTPGTSEWWLRRLGMELDERNRTLTRYEDAYKGRHKLAFASDKFYSAFGNLFKEFADNFCQVVVDAVEERLRVDGFRMGDAGVDADAEAWRIWQANNLDLYSKLAHRSALVKSYSYALVWNNPDDPDTPLITVEDPLQMVVAFAAGSPRKRVAAMKRWKDESGRVFATLYLPDRIEKYQTTTKVHSAAWAGRTWERREVENESWPLNNPLGEVPVVPFVNLPELNGTGESELINVIPIQDAINKLVADMLIASEFASFRQRWIAGMQIPVDPETGEPIETFRAAVDRLWIVEDKDVKFGEFSESDLKPFVSGIEMFVQHLATQTRTPPHYFNAQMGSFPSGESLRAAETGLISKCRNKMDWWGESWEETMRLAFKVLDDDRGRVTDSETIWGDPETRSESEHVDALLKQQAFGIPNEILWERTGYSPQEIARIKEIRAREALEIGTFDPFAGRNGAGEPAVT